MKNFFSPVLPSPFIISLSCQCRRTNVLENTSLLQRLETQTHSSSSALERAGSQCVLTIRCKKHLYGPSLINNDAVRHILQALWSIRARQMLHSCQRASHYCLKITSCSHLWNQRTCVSVLPLCANPKNLAGSLRNKH